MEILPKILIFKILFCLFLTLTLGVWSGIVALADKYDLQIILYLTLLILTIVGIWQISFIKTKKIVKLIYLILFISYLFSPKILPSVIKQFNIDNCLDSGGCWDQIRNRCEMRDRSKCAAIPKKSKIIIINESQY